ncbi:hypothetical protein PInf_004959 [Phytophthora infestans]|nr:hypothetical protein PInf_004959 [Phytophthora infestans]
MRPPRSPRAHSSFTTSADTHNQVREALTSAASLYYLDADKLTALQPDVILTQSTCKVCSIDLASVQDTVGDAAHKTTLTDQLVQSYCASSESTANHLTKIVTCNPTSLVDAVVTQFKQLGDALGVSVVGELMAQEHSNKLKQLKYQADAFVSHGDKPEVLMVEWLDPLFLGTKGWMREIVEAAGGHVVDTLDGGQHVDVVVVALCGLSLDQTEQELLAGRVGDWWRTLLNQSDTVPKVYIVDGTSMFTRPTRRLLDALEWLVHTLHEPESNWLKSSTFPYKLFDTSLVTSDSKIKEKKSAEMLEIEELHRAACANKLAMYTDPSTGNSVMTSYMLTERQVCCGNSCRHCPYGHANVKDPTRRTNTLAGTVLLQPRRRSRGFAKDSPGGQILWPEGSNVSGGMHELVVVFWSGGKDSFLALSALYESYAAKHKPTPRVVLLTTIDPKTNVVPIQNNRRLQLKLKRWSYRLPALERLCAKTGAKIFFSSIDEERLTGTPWQVDQVYDWKLIQEWNKTTTDGEEVDLMGETGEFHTYVKFPGME